MEKITPGVTLMQDFCRPGTNLFKSYIDYLDRDEAQRNKAIQTYNLFHDYMGNPEKSTGLFTNEKDSLTIPEKKELKQIFQTAQDNDSIMWQTVISFDTPWLERNHLYDPQRGFFDEKKIKEVARLGINRMLEKEGLELAVWTASIHYNTDNIHVHVATVEPYPLRKAMMYQGKKEYRGKFKLKSLEMCKSSIVNEILQTREVNQKINHIIRDRILKAKQERLLAEDPEIRSQFLKLYQSLPDVSKNLVNYGNPLMHPYKPLVDSISKMYLEKYHAQDYEEFREITQRQSELYTQAYGLGKTKRSHAEEKEKELMKRLGNAVLKEAKNYEQRLKETIDKKQEFALTGEEESFKPLEGGFQTTSAEHEPKGKKNIDSGTEIGREISNSEEKVFTLDLERKRERELSPELMAEIEQMEDFLNLKENLNKQNNIAENEIGDKTLEKYKEWFHEFKQLKDELNKSLENGFNKNEVQKRMEAGQRNNNPFIIHFMGELHKSGRFLEIDLEKSQQYFAKAFEIFQQDEGNLSEQCGFIEKGKFNFASYVQYRIGKQLDRGWGTDVDYLEAVAWYEKSDTDYARYSMGNLYFQGLGVEKDYQVALELYNSATENAFANLKSAQMYKKGLGCEPSQELSKMYYKMAFCKFSRAEEKAQDDLIEYQLGRMLYSGLGCTADVEKGIEYLEMSAKKNNINAEYLVSTIYIEQEITEKIPEAIERLEKLADKGKHSNAQYALGKLYVNSENEYYDLKKGVGYLTTAAEQKHDYAQYQLGKIYINPETEMYNMDKGFFYLKQSAEQENEYAQYLLGKCYTDPSQEVYDLSEGIRYLELSAEQGNEYAQYRLGVLYTNPEEKVYNLNRGIEFLEKAAMQDNEHAQYRLGKLYMNQELEVYNPSKGVAHLEAAREQGNDAAKYFLGCRYLDTEGAVYNPEKGLEYIKDLAEMGNAYAQTKLGCEYLKGTSVQWDVDEAKTWLSRAAEQNNEIAASILNDINTQGISRRSNRHRGELDRALCRLQRSFEEECRNNMRLIRQREMEQEIEMDTVL